VDGGGSLPGVIRSEFPYFTQASDGRVTKRGAAFRSFRRGFAAKIAALPDAVRVPAAMTRSSSRPARARGGRQRCRADMTGQATLAWRNVEKILDRGRSVHQRDIGRCGQCYRTPDHIADTSLVDEFLPHDKPAFMASRSITAR